MGSEFPDAVFLIARDVGSSTTRSRLQGALVESVLGSGNRARPVRNAFIRESFLTGLAAFSVVCMGAEAGVALRVFVYSR